VGGGDGSAARERLDRNPARSELSRRVPARENGVHRGAVASTAVGWSVTWAGRFAASEGSSVASEGDDRKRRARPAVRRTAC
jgi:hypothetical protein